MKSLDRKTKQEKKGWNRKTEQEKRKVEIEKQ